MRARWCGLERERTVRENGVRACTCARSERCERLCQEKRLPSISFAVPGVMLSFRPREASRFHLYAEGHTDAPRFATLRLSARHRAHDTAYGTVSLPRAAHRQTHTHIMCIQRARLHTHAQHLPRMQNIVPVLVPPPALSSPVCPIFSLFSPPRLASCVRISHHVHNHQKSLSAYVP